MTKPNHFRKVDPDKSCENCQHIKRIYNKPIHVKCLKHDFVVSENLSTRVLEKLVCDDVLPYKEEDY